MVCCICSVFLLAVVHFVALAIYFRITTGKYRVKKNLAGKTYVVTGATAGVGKSTALQLARNGAKVYMACRNIEKAERVKKELVKKSFNNDIHIVRCDLCDFATVKACADELLATGLKIDCLINNAGLMFMRGTKKVTKDGNEEHIQGNHLGHFLLTNLLLKRLTESDGRIVNVSSISGLTKWNVGATKNFDPNDLNFDNRPYSGRDAYACSKLANIMFTRELSKRLIGTETIVNSCHPGAVHSDLLPGSFPKIITAYMIPLAVKAGFFKSSNQGAMTSLYLATSDDVNNVCGEYFNDCAPAAASIQALNARIARELWTASEEKVAAFM